MPSPGAVALSLLRSITKWRDDPDGKTPFAVARIDGNPVAAG
jgi:hypothetical protein